MPRPKGAATRILSTEDRGGSGPGRYRVRYLDAGEQLAIGFATAEKAEAFKVKFEREAAEVAGSTVDALITKWVEDRREQGLSLGAPGEDYYELYVRRILDALLDSQVGVLEGDGVEEGFIAASAGKAGATSKLYLACLKQFGNWLMSTRKTKVDITAGIKPRGVVKRGKPQIQTLRETLAFDAVAVRHAEAGSRGAMACLLGLHLGLRTHEVLGLEPRHVDLHRILRVPGTKTVNAPRSLRIPSDILWGLVERAAAAGGRLVPFSGPTVLPRKVRGLAQEAGVSNASELCFHSLRGTFATLATKNGAPLETVAGVLGHASYAVTGAHYATPESQVEAEQAARFKVLKGGLG